MVTQKGENTHVAAIRGNFDDAQTGVKKLFGDKELAAQLSAAGMRFSSANSINIGRLVPQIAYYVYAYVRLLAAGKIQAGDMINVVVPTGNFGNILAAYYAKQMGMPFGKLICASNQNNVLSDFFANGTYDKNRPFYTSSSPSMDILVSSNLERLLYRICGDNTETVAEWMQQLSEGGVYTVPEEMQKGLSDFYGNYADEETVSRRIHELYQETGYVLDPHTAVASAVYEMYRTETGDSKPAVIASTASPFKFARSVLHAIDGAKYDAMTDMEQFDALAEVAGLGTPAAIEEIKTAPVRHDMVVDINQMRDAVCSILQLK